MDGHSKKHVKRKDNNILCCSCEIFKMKGIIFSHIIKVLREVMNIKEIPEHYILKKWTKQIRAQYVQDFLVMKFK